MTLTKMQLKICNQNLFLKSNLKNDLKRSFFVYYYTTFAVALFVLCYLFFFEEGQGFNCVYKTVYNKECSTCGLTRDLHSIFINHKNFEKLEKICSGGEPVRPISLYLKIAKIGEIENGEIIIGNEDFTADIFDISWRRPLF